MSEAALATAQDYLLLPDHCGFTRLWRIWGGIILFKAIRFGSAKCHHGPDDTGMVTLMSQNLSEFAVHARAILGLPIPAIKQLGPTASAVLLVKGQSQQMSFSGLHQALQEPDTELRLFGKPEVQGERRLGVALAQDQEYSSWPSRRHCGS